MATILIVEDEPDISDFVKEKLVSERHAVDVAATGPDAIAFLDTYSYDLAILDLNIPPPDGLEILKYIRTKYRNLKVLMLTSRQEIDDRLRGFEAGADDYVGKPFDMRELLARINALLSRPAQVAESVLKWDNITLNSSKFEVFQGTKQIHLQRKDFALLEFLMRHPTEVFSSDTILERVFGADTNASNVGLRVAINRIRKAIDSPESENSIIENVNRVGYKIGRSS